MGKQIEAIDAVELRRQLSNHGFEYDRQTGSHIRLKNADGISIGIPDHSHPVTTVLLREIGRTAFGLNLHDTRLLLGMTTPGKSSATRKRTNRRVKTTTTPRNPPPVDALVGVIHEVADSIYRSPTARRATRAQRTELERITQRLNGWRCELETGAA